MTENYGNNVYSFTYNDDGIRTSKTKNGVKTTYYLNGSQIIGEETNGNISLYIYDSKGSVIGMQYYASTYAEGVYDEYWFEKNIQGDIVAIYDDEGTKLISYLYDAWGSTTIVYHNGGNNTTAVNNPFTYRGYYYDKDLGFYYLNSRYYDPYTCRFISADSYVSTGQGFIGHNMYAYCGNNPVMRVDKDGDFWNWVDYIASSINSIVVGVCALIDVLIPSEEHNYSITEDTVKDYVHIYEYGCGESVEGKINVIFYPNNEINGTSNPSFRIENSYKISSRKEQEIILMHIMESEYYDPNVYGRTLKALIIEWDLHNVLFKMYGTEQYQHADFDKLSEGSNRLEILVNSLSWRIYTQ